MARPLTLPAAALLIGTLVTGCYATRYHRARNAPGIVDVAVPPPANRLAEEGAARPADPGENMVTFNPGIYGGGGYRWGMPSGTGGTYLGGVELTLNRGWNPRSHYRDGFFVYPLHGEGVSLGWTFLQGHGDDVDVGPLYVEAHRFQMIYGGGLGYAVDPSDGDHGPQTTFWFGPYYVRARYLFDGGFAIYTGGQLKFPFVWIWSR